MTIGGEEASVHGDGEWVEESDLADDKVELGVPMLEETDAGLPGYDVVAVAGSV